MKASRPERSPRTSTRVRRPAHSAERMSDRRRASAAAGPSSLFFAILVSGGLHIAVSRGAVRSHPSSCSPGAVVPGGNSSAIIMMSQKRQRRRPGCVGERLSRQLKAELEIATCTADRHMLTRPWDGRRMSRFSSRSCRSWRRAAVKRGSSSVCPGLNAARSDGVLRFSRRDRGFEYNESSVVRSRSAAHPRAALRPDQHSLLPP